MDYAISSDPRLSALYQRRTREDDITSALYDPNNYIATAERIANAAKRAKGELPSPFEVPQQGGGHRPTLAEWERAVRKANGEII
jgi:hypothetical protein